MKPRINYAKPSITALEISMAADAMSYSWGDHYMEYIERFETAFKDHLGVKYAMATSSCTGALHIGLTALGIGPGDEVILPDTTWIATAAAVTYLGAKPVFVDILPGTWCIDPAEVEKAITWKTKAIIAVHLYGNVAEINRLLMIGHQHGIPVIEDAAEAIGSELNGKKCGSMGRFGVFSFHASKTVTTGEGGMFVTYDRELYEKALKLSNHGRSKTVQFFSDQIGYKYKMTPIQAAIGYAQMQRIDDLINRKRKIFNFYHEYLSEAAQMNPEPPWTVNGYWMPTVVFDEKPGVTREALQKEFEKENIDTRVFFHPLSSMPMFDEVNNKNAYSIPKRAMNLPSYHDMTNEDQVRVIECIYRAMA